MTNINHEIHRSIIVVAHNIRSTHNIGSLFRTCEGLGVDLLYLTGYTPYPKVDNDDRLPYIADKVHQQIKKTALGAEETLSFKYENDPVKVISDIKNKGYKIVALEQSSNSEKINSWSPPQKIAVILGEEVEGINRELLSLANTHIEIPMFGKKESFNVVQAAAMFLFHCRFSTEK